MTGQEAAPAPIVLGNEFAEIRVARVDGRNGPRLVIESPRTGHRVELCPLELEALTWQAPETFSAMLARPQASLVDPGAEPGAEPGEEPG